MIAIVDYGVGNLFSLCSSLRTIGAETVVTSEPKQIAAADRIILPGVGAFGDAADKLRETGLGDVVKQQAAAGKDVLGICLGMQLLFESSCEYGEHAGLGLLRGHVTDMRGRIAEELKIPHIGWNDLKFPNKGRLFKNVPEGTYVYFVHSYYLDADDKSIVTATTEYGTTVEASVECGNVFATQFHPEKSSDMGLMMLRNFVDIVKG